MLFRSLLQVLSSHLDRLWGWYAALILGFFLVVSLYMLGGPRDSFAGKSISIPYGTSVATTAQQLEQEHIIRSPFLFKVLVVFFFKPHGVQAGLYSFPIHTSVYTVAWRITHGITGTRANRVTLPEGTSVRTMANILKRSLTGFDDTAFIKLGTPFEGYLFPDTYFFAPSANPNEVLEILRDTYSAHTDWKEGFTLTDQQERDAVILASLLEGEAKTPEDKKIVAGVLLKRISLHMPLQVDAPFGYEKGIAGYMPTHEDTVTDSLYNTYRRQGLPPTPINNPGEESLSAALRPTPSDYLYYLTGSDGAMHYAKTFKEHIGNQQLYFK